MKSLKDYSLNIPEQEYHDYPAWSHSLIARYAKEGFSSIATLHDKFQPTPSMEFGSLFDSMMTRGKETFDEYVVDTTGINIEPAEKAVFDKMISLGYTDSYDSLSAATIKMVYESCDTFCSKYKKEETRYKKLWDSREYFELHRQGKKVVSKEDWNDAVEMVKVFRNDPYLKELFGTKNADGIEYLYQVQFVTDYKPLDHEEVKVKCMFDLLVVNHNDKTIQPVDLKTSSVPAYDFKENFISFRYDLQAELYTDVLSDVVSKIPEYRDYTILPYLFTDISRTDKIPVTYTYDPRNGFYYTRGERTYEYKGWKILLEEILTYEKNGAKVPSGIILDGPNDIIDILSR